MPFRYRSKVSKPTSSWIGRNLPTAWPLDGVSNVSGVFSLRRMLNNYNGLCLKVRRSNDNALWYIGFDEYGNLDEAELLSFAGANSAYVDTWYDQSQLGNRALTQATTSAQPRIVNAGVVDKKNGRPALVFSGGQSLAVSNANIFVSGAGLWTANVVTYISSTATNNQGFVDADNGTTLRLAQFLRNSTSTFESVAFNTVPTSFSATAAGTPLASGALAVGTAVRDTNLITVYGNGTAGTGVSITGTGATAAATFRIGTGPVSAVTGGVCEVVMFSAALSSTNRQLLERNQGAYYGVDVA